MRTWDLVPRGPVITARARTARFGAPAPSGAVYAAQPAIGGAAPLLPVMPFGLTYALDLVFMTQHATWNMHEYACIQSGSGRIWLCKDAREGSLEQTIIADVPDIEDWMPEVPVLRRAHRIEVEEHVGADRVRVGVDYVNWDGERTEVRFDGPAPRGPRWLRNSSTMGHSAGHLMATLDLSHQALGRGELRIDGRAQAPVRVLGVPIRAALRQTQGGLATGRWVQRSAGEGTAAMTTTFSTRSGREIARTWTVARDDAGGVELAQIDPLRTLVARFARRGDALELAAMEVRQHGQAAAALCMQLSPTLPDLRLPFAGAHRSSWVADVGGQPGHAIGGLVARWTEDGPEVDLEPEAPRWVVDRPMRSRLRGEGDGVRVVVERIAAI